MPKGGHNRKPTQLKVIQGTAQPCRMNPNEPKPRPVAPAMPRGLDRWAQQAWKRDAPVLERLGLLTEADLDLFLSYCQAFSRYVQATRRLRKTVKQSPDDLDIIRKAEVSVEKAEHSMRLLAIEFGLTPAARSRLSVPEVEDDAEDFFAARPKANS